MKKIPGKRIFDHSLKLNEEVNNEINADCVKEMYAISYVTKIQEMYDVSYGRPRPGRAPGDPTGGIDVGI